MPKDTIPTTCFHAMEKQQIVALTDALSMHVGSVLPQASVDFLDKKIRKKVPGWPGLLTYLEGVQAALRFDRDFEELSGDIDGVNAVVP